jgi:hypothetical protein
MQPEREEDVKTAKRQDGKPHVYRRVKRDVAAVENPDYAELLAQRDEEDKERRAYLVREFVQCSFPYSNPGADVSNWSRKNGDLTFTVTRTNPGFPIPYGSLPRLVMFYVCTSIIEKKSRRIPIEGSLTQALKDFGYTKTSAQKGYSRENYKQQVLALCNSALSFHYDTNNRNAGYNVMFATKYDLWWDERNPNQDALFPSYVEVTEEFYQAVMNSPVPIPKSVIRNHVKSPLELDLLVMLNHRIYSVNKQGSEAATFITSQQLHLQFGQEYARVRDFRAKLRRALENIKTKSWPGLNYSLTYEGLAIRRSPSLVQPKRAQEGIRKGAHLGSTIVDEILRSKRFDPHTLEKAKAAAPRWDVYALQAQFWTWVEQEEIEIEKDPRAMFVSFCRSHAKNNRA